MCKCWKFTEKKQDSNSGRNGSSDERKCASLKVTWHFLVALQKQRDKAES